MAFPFIPVVGALVKVVSKILPDKPKEIIEGVVAKAVMESKELRDFSLQWFGTAEQLPKWALACKNLWRPLCAVTGFFYCLVWHATHGGDLPVKIWGLVIAIVITFGASRGIEKIKKHIV